MKRILNVIGSIVGVITTVVITILISVTAIEYLMDPRPREYSVECEVKQEAIFKRPINRVETPAEYLKEIRDACK